MSFVPFCMGRKEIYYSYDYFYSGGFSLRDEFCNYDSLIFYLLCILLYWVLTEIMRKVRIYLHQEPYFKEGGKFFPKLALAYFSVGNNHTCILFLKTIVNLNFHL